MPNYLRFLFIVSCAYWLSLGASNLISLFYDLAIELQEITQGQNIAEWFRL